MERNAVSQAIGLLLFIVLISSLGIHGCQPVISVPRANSTPKGLPIKELSNSLTFFAMGDWGVYGQLHQQLVANQMETYAAELAPTFLILAGDNFYPAGVSSNTDLQWKVSFENVYTGPHLPSSFYIALGNHDYQESVQAQIDYGRQHTRWFMPSRYYTQRIAINKQSALRLIVIDTNPFVQEYRANTATFPDILQDTGKQVKWIDSVLANASEPWKIVVGHHPLYSVGGDHGNQPELLQQLGPLLKKYGVQLYLCGHSHTLQHLAPVGQTDFIISGGGGAPLGPIADSTKAQFARSSGGFSVFSLNTDSLRMGFIDTNGKLLYRWQRGRTR
ncbi:MULTISPECIES: tartrate-resistant acid phosphatase type 5 family protein [unclassified Spirosoma]|uniref:purple acid phosphatase family protein n=1 Tax=unclassified Spirosoma TaxID=2621999 RepID=UPI00095A4426|nr:MULTISPECIES: tartrate-resistant acid phosphatase type 5 family protein [unclassified Spirosoma]OJW72833.1 MAG: acid phosphatase [Spirosoma sp. 48-14]